MKEKVVFEYSWENKKFNEDNPNNRKNLELIFDKGIDNVEVLTMVTDNNTISNFMSTQLTYLFKLIETNKSMFIEYCKILQSDGKLHIPEPEDEKIAKDKKLLANFCNREAFVQACPTLIQKLLEVNAFIKSFNGSNNLNLTTLHVENELNHWSFYLRIDTKLYNDLFIGDNALDNLKIKTVGEDLIGFPRTLILEEFVPYCVCRLAYDEKQFNERRKIAVIEHLEQTLNLNNYFVLLH